MINPTIALRPHQQQQILMIGELGSVTEIAIRGVLVGLVACDQRPERSRVGRDLTLGSPFEHLRPQQQGVRQHQLRGAMQANDGRPEALAD
jgi:hypothetical protein